MKKEFLLSLIRSALVVGGTYLLGTNLFGKQLDAVWWEEITGAVLALIGTLWSFAGKKLTIELWQSFIMKLLAIAGTLLVTSGKVSNENFQSWAGLVTSLFSVIYPLLSKAKNQGIKNAQIPVSKLS